MFRRTRRSKRRFWTREVCEPYDFVTMPDMLTHEAMIFSFDLRGGATADQESTRSVRPHLCWRGEVPWLHGPCLAPSRRAQ